MIDGKHVIALDAMGGENAPAATIAGAVASLSNLDVELLLVGREDAIKAELDKHSCANSRIEIVSASEVVSDEEHPVAAIKTKKNSSIVVGLNLLKAKRAEAFISAGSTGALLAGAALVVGRIKGIERPAIATLVPTPQLQPKPFVLIDSGANVDCRPSHLVQFAIMGTVYMQTRLGVQNPRVGLINIGTEAEKGNTLVKESYRLLNETGLNFVGNVEAKNLPFAAVDVAVCDAFVGNVVLKLSEGLVKAMFGLVKTSLTSSPRAKLGALLARSALTAMKASFDADEIGGAPFLGISSLVVKAHGSSSARAIASAVNQCVALSKNDTVIKTEQALQEYLAYGAQREKENC